MPRPRFAPGVDFGEGLVESATHVKLRQLIPFFDGPLALLLAVIEARQLDVLTVPLGGLAAAYLDALATLEGDRLGNVSAFVAVAGSSSSSRAGTLPRPPNSAAVPLDDELDPEAELRARLLEYRRFRDAGGDSWRTARRASPLPTGCRCRGRVPGGPERVRAGVEPLSRQLRVGVLTRSSRPSVAGCARDTPGG